MRSIGFATGALLLGLCGAPAMADELYTYLSNARFAGLLTGMTPDGRFAIGYLSRSDGNYGFRWDGASFVPYDEDLPYTQPLFISTDGRVVAGNQSDSRGQYTAGRWVDGAWTPITVYAAGGVGLAGMSADGTVVVGNSDVFINGTGRATRAFRLDTAATSNGLTDDDLLLFDGTGRSHASGVSADGRVVIGSAEKDGSFHAFRWTVGDSELTELLPGVDGSSAPFVSSDGSVVAVTGASGTGYRWTKSTNALALDGLKADGTGIVFISDMSRDGSVMVGIGLTEDNQPRAVRWVGTDVQNLGTIDDQTSVGYKVSGDGKVVFAIVTPNVDDATTFRATRWTEGKPMTLVTDILRDGGVNVGAWEAEAVTVTSFDGTVFGGIGHDDTSPGIWIARCTSLCAVIKEADLARSLSGLGAMGATTSLHLNAEIDAGRDMTTSAGASGTAATAFAYGAYDSDPTTSFTAGGTYSLGDDLIVGGSVGIAGIATDMTDGGRSEFIAPTFGGFIGSRPNSGLNWSLGASGTAFSGNVTRAYLNGVDPVTSTGSTTGSGFAIGAEAGWTFDSLLADVLVTPFVNVTLSSTSFAGYTETDGPFPATIAGFTTSSALVKLGVDGRYRFGTDAWLNGGIAYGHNGADGGTITGVVPGIIGASAGGTTLPADFVEISAGLDMPVGEQLRFSARTALTLPFDGPASIQARAGLSLSF